MTLKELDNKSEEFRKLATQLCELISTTGLLRLTSCLIRDTGNLQSMLREYVRVKDTILEEKFEELVRRDIYLLDQLAKANEQKQKSLVTDFLIKGYDLFSIFRMSFFQAKNQKLSQVEK